MKPYIYQIRQRLICLFSAHYGIYCSNQSNFSNKKIPNIKSSWTFKIQMCFFIFVMTYCLQIKTWRWFNLLPLKREKWFWTKIEKHHKNFTKKRHVVSILLLDFVSFTYIHTLKDKIRKNRWNNTRRHVIGTDLLKNVISCAFKPFK